MLTFRHVYIPAQSEDLALLGTLYISWYEGVR